MPLGERPDLADHLLDVFRARLMPLGERPDLADHLLDPLFGLDFSLWLLEAGGFPDVPLALGQETYDLVVHHVYALPHLIEALGVLLEVERHQDLLGVLSYSWYRSHNRLDARG